MDQFSLIIFSFHLRFTTSAHFNNPIFIMLIKDKWNFLKFVFGKPLLTEIVINGDLVDMNKLQRFLRVTMKSLRKRRMKERIQDN